MCTVYLYNIYTCANTKYGTFLKKIAKLYQWRTKDLSVAHCADYLWRTVQITRVRH